MRLINYKPLIANLPVREQAFTTKRVTWLHAEKYDWIKLWNDTWFNQGTELELSRNDLFLAQDTKELIVKTIYWGYPRGMRGNHFWDIVDQINPISEKLQVLRENASIHNWEIPQQMLSTTSGLGLSTLTKFLYFGMVLITGMQCLILDQRLINVFKSKLFDEFTSLAGISYLTAPAYYLSYLETMHEQAEKLDVKPENLEQFLFIFGNHLKP